MKNFLITSWIVTTSFVATAQTPSFKEWFRQQKTQRQYLIQQIAALQVQLGYVKKGYQIMDKGLTMIGTIKDATHNMDNTYFSSLKQVSPVITNSPKYRETTELYQKILDALQTLAVDSKDDNNFSQKERLYIQAIYEKMRADCSAVLDAFFLAVSPEIAEMQDAERLSRLDQVHNEMKERYTFTLHFVSTTRALSSQRAKERRTIDLMRKLNGTSES